MSRISVIVKQSCTSAMSSLLGPDSGHRHRRVPTARRVAGIPRTVDFSWRYGWSVADAEPGDVDGPVGELVGALGRDEEHRGGAVGLGAAVEQVQRVAHWGDREHLRRW